MSRSTGRREGSSRGRRRGRGLGGVAASAALLAAALGAGPGGAEAAACADADHPGGDWPSLNRDVANSRHQQHESVIGPDEARLLTPAWATSVEDAGAIGNLHSTPTVGGGCVYVGTTGGWVIALNADTGDVVWTFSAGGGKVMAVSYDGGFVYFTTDTPGNLRAHALEAATGTGVWRTGPLTEGPEEGQEITASPVVFDIGPSADPEAPQRMVFVALSLAQGPDTRVPYYLLDAASGATILRGFPIPEEDRAHGHGGGGIWGTAAVDVGERHLYVGTSDPEPYTRDHPHNGAVLKIDVNPERGTFGEVVGAHKGRFDQYVPGTDRQPICPVLGDDTPVLFQESSPACGQLDHADFGASPNLFVDADGHTMVTVLQKSGVFFGIYTPTMTVKWEALLSYPAFVGNAATAAVGDGGIYVSANPGSVYGLNSLAWVEWLSTIAGDAARYMPMSLANGVVYTQDMKGALHAWDAETGVPLLHRSMSVDVGDACANLGGGVSIARNTVYAQCDLAVAGGWVVAYQPAALL